MYDVPDTGSGRSGAPLTVADLLAGGLSVSEAYRHVPADSRSPLDPQWDAQMTWRPAAAVLRELHRQRAAELAVADPCAACLEGLVPELLTEVAHPYGHGWTVRLVDAVADLACGVWELAAAGRSVTALVDAFLADAGADPAGRRCALCGEVAPGPRAVPGFAVTLLSLAATWAFEAGVARESTPVLDAAFDDAVARHRAAPDGHLLALDELFERVAEDPHLLAAEAWVPPRWADSDWGDLGRVGGGAAGVTELAAELAVPAPVAARSIVLVAGWLLRQCR